MSHNTPNKSYPAQGSNPPARVPDSQLRALERRHSLDEQQRGFVHAVPAPHFLRPRRPN